MRAAMSEGFMPIVDYLEVMLSARGAYYAYLRD
jgi:hypothetical protein